MSIRDRLLDWLDLPSKEWIHNRICILRRDIEFTQQGIDRSGRHWSAPHSRPVIDRDQKPDLVPDGHPFPRLFKTDDEAMDEWEDAILEKWFLTEWDAELQKLLETKRRSKTY